MMTQQNMAHDSARIEKFDTRDGQNFAYFANKSLKLSGKILEFRVFDRFFSSHQFTTLSEKKEASDLSPDDLRDKAISRARKSIRDLVNSNAYAYYLFSGRAIRPIFVTLTFRENITSLTSANTLFTRFVRSLTLQIEKQSDFNKQYTLNDLHNLKITFSQPLHEVRQEQPMQQQPLLPRTAFPPFSNPSEFMKNRQSIRRSPLCNIRKLKYLAVPEFQKRGAVHYHVVFFNIPFIHRIKDLFTELWTYGFSQVRAVDRIDNLGRYLSKYLSKDFYSLGYTGKKSYFTSQGLQKPLVTNFDEIIGQVLSLVPLEALAFEKQGIDLGYLGKMDYQQFSLKNYPQLADQIAELIAQV